MQQFAYTYDAIVSSLGGVVVDAIASEQPKEVDTGWQFQGYTYDANKTELKRVGQGRW